MSKTEGSEAVVGEIERKTRRRHSSEEKIRIVLEGLRGEQSVSEPGRLGDRGGAGKRDDANRPDGDIIFYFNTHQVEITPDATSMFTRKKIRGLGLAA